MPSIADDPRFPFPIGATVEADGRRYTVRSYTRDQGHQFNMVVGRINPQRPDDVYPVGETIGPIGMADFRLVADQPT